MVTSGDWSGTLGTFAPTKLMALGFTTTSADAWKDLLTFATVVSWSDDLRQYSTTAAPARLRPRERA